MEIDVQKNIYYLKGNLDLYSTSEFRGLMPIENSIIIDMSETTYIDSSGLGSLITLQKSLAKTAKTLTLKKVPDSIYKIFALTKVLNFFIIEDSNRRKLPESSQANSKR